ncbi:MAG: APC family permease [Myxococcota bacterium]
MSSNGAGLVPPSGTAPPGSVAGERLNPNAPNTPGEVDSVSDFAGWGTIERLDVGPEAVEVQHLDSGVGHKLGEFSSTAICGNDITSSCLYVAALCTIQAGPYAFVCLAAVAAMLYLFRNIYAEVGTALPLNGGAYNALLNTTSKFRASLAACLTILSYLATAVISAGEAMHYLFAALDNHSHGAIIAATVGLLGFFAFLSLVGITESAFVAIGIFVLHIGTLLLLVGSALFSFDLATFQANWAQGPPGGGSLAKGLLFGFAAGLLGISGFESSANFIEEQKEGVFPKTLRNMWVAVAFFNPVISFLSMGVMPLNKAWKEDGGEFKPSETFLADMGSEAATGLAGADAGSFLATLISYDAVFVLSGAVLTAYVGTTGLVRRMALDRCLPQFLLRENKFRKTNHWIIIGFFLLCLSVVMVTDGDIGILAGVYTISFLGVMALFATGNMLLKVKRKRLPRPIRASWPSVVVALLAVLVGLAANAMIDFPDRLKVFVAYFAAAVLVVALTFLRASILKVSLAVLRWALAPLNRSLERKLHEINNQRVVFFTKGDNRANLNRAALYVLENEQTTRMKVVHVYSDPAKVDEAGLVEQLSTVDELYPELRIDLVLVKGHFGPELIEKLSRQMGVPKNYMFLGTPGDRFPHNIAQLGGVRLII